MLLSEERKQCNGTCKLVLSKLGVHLLHHQQQQQLSCVRQFGNISARLVFCLMAMVRLLIVVSVCSFALFLFVVLSSLMIDRQHQQQLHHSFSAAVVSSRSDGKLTCQIVLVLTRSKL